MVMGNFLVWLKWFVVLAGFLTSLLGDGHGAASVGAICDIGLHNRPCGGL